MSLVGPRPCLPSQLALIAARERVGLFDFRPGITGLAQVRNVDMSDIEALVKLEIEMMSSFSLKRYFALIFATVFGR